VSNESERASPEKFSYIEDLSAINEMLPQDAIIFGLRMNEGVDLSEFKKRWPAYDFQKYETLWHSLLDEGYIYRNGARIRLTVEGQLRADAIAVNCLEYSK
jgi:oxygen-independent coproporphyrinogen-3 oxidase